MVVDRSGSMRAEMEFDGRQMTRLDAVKNIFKNFALGDGKDLPGQARMILSASFHLRDIRIQSVP